MPPIGLTRIGMANFIRENGLGERKNKERTIESSMSSSSQNVLSKPNLENYLKLVIGRVNEWKNSNTRDEEDIKDGVNLIKQLERIIRNFDQCAVLRKPLPEKDQQTLIDIGFEKVNEIPKWSDDMMKNLEKFGGNLVQYDDESSEKEDEENSSDIPIEDDNDDLIDLPTLGDNNFSIEGTNFDLNEYLKEQEDEVKMMTSGFQALNMSKKRPSDSSNKSSQEKQLPTPERMIQKALFEDSIRKSMDHQEKIEEEEEIAKTSSSEEEEEEEEEGEEDDENEEERTKQGFPIFSGTPDDMMMMVMGYDEDDNEYIPTKKEVRKNRNENRLSPIEPPKSHDRKPSPPQSVKNNPKVNNVAVVNEFVPPGILSRQRKIKEDNRENDEKMKKYKNIEEEEGDDDDDDDDVNEPQNNDRDFEHILNLSQLEKETEIYENRLLNKIHNLNPLKKEEDEEEINRSHQIGGTPGSLKTRKSKTTTTEKKPRRSPYRSIQSSTQFPLPTPPQFPRFPGSSSSIRKSSEKLKELPEFSHPTTTPSANIINNRNRRPPSTFGSATSTTSNRSLNFPDGTRNESLMMEEFEKIRTHELGQFKQFLKDVQGEFKEVFRNKLSKEEFYGMYKELKQEIEKIKSEKDDKLEREFHHLKQMIRKHIPNEEEISSQLEQKFEENKRVIKNNKKKKKMNKKKRSPIKKKSRSKLMEEMSTDDDEEEERIFSKTKERNNENDDDIDDELEFHLRKQGYKKLKKEEEERKQYHLMLNQTIKEENQMLRTFVRHIKTEMKNRKSVLEEEIERLKQLVGECSLKDFSSMPVKQQEFEKLTEYEMKIVQLETINGTESSHQMYYPDDINDPIDHELSRILNELPITGGVRIEIEKMEQSRYLADQILNLRMVGGSTVGSGGRRDGILVITNLNNTPLEDYLMELYAPFVSEEKRRVYLRRSNSVGVVGGRRRKNNDRMMVSERVGIIDDDENGNESVKIMNLHPSNLRNVLGEEEDEYDEMEGMVLPTGSSQMDLGMDLLGRNVILEKMKFERSYKSPELGVGMEETRQKSGKRRRGRRGGRGRGRRGGRKRYSMASKKVDRKAQEDVVGKRRFGRGRKKKNIGSNAGFMRNNY